MSVRIEMDKPGSCRQCPLVSRREYLDCPVIKGSDGIETPEEQYALCPVREAPEGCVREALEEKLALACRERDEWKRRYEALWETVITGGDAGTERDAAGKGEEK